MNGSLTAATRGGISAFRIAMTRDVTSAPRKDLTSTCGTIPAATNRDAAATSHDTSSLSGLSLGRTNRSSGATERILTCLRCAGHADGACSPG